MKAQTINVGSDGGTIALAKWIRMNNYPNLPTTFVCDAYGITTLIVSDFNVDEITKNVISENEFWEVLPGIKRLYDKSLQCWILIVDEHWYIVSIY